MIKTFFFPNCLSSWILILVSTFLFFTKHRYPWIVNVTDANSTLIRNTVLHLSVMHMHSGSRPASSQSGLRGHRQSKVCNYPSTRVKGIRNIPTTTRHLKSPYSLQLLERKKTGNSSWPRAKCVENEYAFQNTKMM